MKSNTLRKFPRYSVKISYLHFQGFALVCFTMLDSLLSKTYFAQVESSHNDGLHFFRGLKKEAKATVRNPEGINTDKIVYLERFGKSALMPRYQEADGYFVDTLLNASFAIPYAKGLILSGKDHRRELTKEFLQGVRN